MINIVYMAYRRLQYAETIFQIFAGCKNKNFHLTICGVDTQLGEFQDLLARARQLGLNADLLMVPSYVSNYMDKINLAIQLDYEYSVKMDEDIFMSSASWDQYLDMIPVILADPTNLSLAPAISSGIPTIDYFLQNNLTEPQRAEMNRLLSSTKIPNVWGVYYDALDAHLKQSGYHVEGWYPAVAKLNHFYKGIHPIRVGCTAQVYLNDCIIQNIAGFFEERAFEVEAAWQPYFCNSFFAINTATWREVIGREDLKRDPFDEVTINLYRHETGKKFIFIRNSFAIHTLYNTLFADLPNDRAALERQEDLIVSTIANEMKERKAWLER
jgi:hypothetical protein